MTKKLVFITEARFFCDSNNNIYYAKDFDITLWDRYLEYFDSLIVVARVKETNSLDDFVPLSIQDSRLKFVKLPYFLGLSGLLKKKIEFKKVLEKEIVLLKDCFFILRVPGTIGYAASKFLNSLNIKYGVEVVGDPAEVFKNGNFNHPLRPLLRLMAIYQLKYVVKNASTVLYVTKSTLQRKYPHSPKVSSFGISDVLIQDSIICKKPKKHFFEKNYRIVSVGSLSQMYKSPDILLRAIKIINAKNDFIVNLTWLGEGIYKEKMINLAQELGIVDFVDFRGSVSREDVVSCMIGSDLFVLASRTEGLPRVIIEAMAMGLPIVATNVGGIPELLPLDVLVPPNNAEALAEKIYQILTKPELYDKHANINLINSHEFKKTLLDEKRKVFFDTVVNL